MASKKNRIAGEIYIKVDGAMLAAKGSFTYNLGKAKRETIYGSNNKPLGYKEMPNGPKIEGALTDTADFDLEAFLELDEATVTLELANGKVIVLSDAWYAGEGDVNTEEGEVTVLFNGLDCKEDKHGSN